MKRSLNDILGGKFLVDGNAIKNWRMIIFLSLLALVMIGSSHKADEKVHNLGRLREQVKELRSEHVGTSLTLRRLKMKSAVAQKVKDKGILPGGKPPVKIVVTSSKK